MAFTLPAEASTVGDAEKIRFIYMASLSKSYVGWVYSDVQGTRFALREFPGVAYDEVILPGTFGNVENLYLVESLVVGNVVFLWDDGRDVHYAVWDIEGEVFTTTATFLTPGTVPTAADDGVLKALYLREFDVKMRENIVDPEQTLVRTSSRLIRDLDIDIKDNVPLPEGAGKAILYSGNHGLDLELGLIFQKQPATELLYRTSVQTTEEDLGLAPGAQHYWKHDEASGNLVDSLGALTGTAAGAVITTPGRVGTARNYDGSNDYFNFGNPAAIQALTGDMFISMWIRGRAGHLAARRNPIAKSYSSEFTWTAEQNGTINAFYGNNPTTNSGGAWAPVGYDQINTGVVAVVQDVWKHVAWTRSFSNGRMRWFVDGQKTSEVPTFYGGAAASNGTFYLGRGYVSDWLGDLDEVLIGNQELFPNHAQAMYERGLLGLEADAIHTVVSGTVTDLSDEGNDAEKPEGIRVNDSGMVWDDPNKVLTPGAPLANISSSFTAEFLIVPRMQSKSANLMSGDLRLTYFHNGAIQFGFNNGSEVVFTQARSSRVRLDPHRVNHIAISHTFGSGLATLLTINGKPVTAEWQGGTGDEDPGFSGVTLSFGAGLHDTVKGIRMSTVAKNSTTILDYAKGLIP